MPACLKLFYDVADLIARPPGADLKAWVFHGIGQDADVDHGDNFTALVFPIAIGVRLPFDVVTFFELDVFHNLILG